MTRSVPLCLNTCSCNALWFGYLGALEDIVSLSKPRLAAPVTLWTVVPARSFTRDSPILVAQGARIMAVWPKWVTTPLILPQDRPYGAGINTILSPTWRIYLKPTMQPNRPATLMSDVGFVSEKMQHMQRTWYSPAHYQCLSHSTRSGNIEEEAWPGSSCHNEDCWEGYRWCERRPRKERPRRIWFVSEEGSTHQKACRSQERVKIRQGGCDLKVESDLSSRVDFSSCCSHYTCQPSPVHMVRYCRHPYCLRTHCSVGRTHAESK